MKKLRGIKLGHSLVRVWRYVVRRRRRRRRPDSYLHLGGPASPPFHRPPKPTTVADRVLTWGRVLKQLLSAERNRLLPVEGRKRPSRPPRGHLVVYVGKHDDGGHEPLRYLVPVVYVNHPLFGDLLREAEEVYGFHHPGVLTIPCAVADFESVTTRVAAASEKVGKKLPCF